MTFSLAFLLTSLVATISTTTCFPHDSNLEVNSKLFQHSYGNIRRELAPVRAHEIAERSIHGIQAELVHKDHHLRVPLGYSYTMTAKERVERDLHSSKRRAEFLLSSRARMLVDSSPLGKTFVSNLSLSLNEADYVMTISLGTPPQNFVAVADTGSDLTWLQCAPCAGCLPQVDPVFDPKLSSSYKNLSCSDTACQNFISSYQDQNPNCDTNSNSSCDYIYAYADGTNTTGDFSSEAIHLQTVGGNITTIPNFAFGCSHTVYSDSGLIPGTVDGLVGLGQGAISLPYQLGSTFGNIFSYCLLSVGKGLTMTSPLLFGEGALANSTRLQFTSLLPYTTSLYFVGLEGISVGGQQLSISSTMFAFNGTHGGTIFDSGTTYTQLQSQALDALATFLIANLSFTQVESPIAGVEYCWLVSGMSDDEIASTIPTITFRFTNADYDLSYENAFISTRLIVRITCLAFMRAGEFSSQTIIGNHQQRNKLIVYDRANQRLGFVTRDCSAPAAGSSGFSSSTSNPSSASRLTDQLKSVMTYICLLPIIVLMVVRGVQ